MFEFDLIQCGMLVLGLMVVGEIVSRYMKAAIPAILISALLYLACVWGGILPNTLIVDSGLTMLTSISMMFVILNMGASTNVRELMDNWKVVALAGTSYFCQIGIMLCVIGLLFGWNMAIGSLPGGASVALMVQERARSLGYDEVVLLSALLLSVKGLISCPLASYFLKREVIRLLRTGFRMDMPQEEEEVKKPNRKETALGREISKHESPYLSLFRFFILAWLASRLEMLCGVSRYVFCLLLGVLMAHLGFLHKDEMDRTKSHGMLMLMMMTAALNGFSSATPELFMQMMKPLVCVLAVEVVSIFLISTVLGKRFGLQGDGISHLPQCHGWFSAESDAGAGCDRFPCGESG